MEDEESEKKPAPVEKKGKGRLIGIVIAVVLASGAGVAGAVMGPKFFGNAQEKQAKTEETEEGEAEAAEHGADQPVEEGEEPAETKATEKSKTKPKPIGEVHEVTNLQPILVDVAAAQGPTRHIKVVLSIEHPKSTKEADFKVYVPRAREAAIVYLRSKDFEELTDAKNFSRLLRELNKTLIEAVGKERAHRVLITDFVAQ